MHSGAESKRLVMDNQGNVCPMMRISKEAASDSCDAELNMSQAPINVSDKEALPFFVSFILYELVYFSQHSISFLYPPCQCKFHI